jgi:serine/threonine-protein kinase SRPK3
MDTVEDVEEYGQGGYHPGHLGDILNERYKVLHKLGPGGLSTTWLARDSTEDKYRAVKILEAEETTSSTEF